MNALKLQDKPRYEITPMIEKFLHKFPVLPLSVCLAVAFGLLVIGNWKIQRWVWRVVPCKSSIWFERGADHIIRQFPCKIRNVELQNIILITGIRYAQCLGHFRCAAHPHHIPPCHPSFLDRLYLIHNESGAVLTYHLNTLQDSSWCYRWSWRHRDGPSKTSAEDACAVTWLRDVAPSVCSQCVR